LDKQKKIVEMFNSISPTYDLANRVLSFGIDTAWRRNGCNKSFEILGKKELNLVIDVACGTGDMILFWQKQASAKGVKIKEFLGVDPSSGMLEVARKKLPEIRFQESMANSIDARSGSGDIVSISYGIRNVLDRKPAFDEFNRVLKIGGLLVILEFTKNDNPGFVDKVNTFYTKKVLPFIGGALSKNYEAYKYLPDSIEGFLTSSDLETEYRASGFETVFKKSYSGGISTLFIAKKIKEC